MLKFALRLSVFVLIIMSCNIAAYSLDVKDTYNCPSMFNYNPMVTQFQFCQDMAPYVKTGMLKQGKCAEYYESIYGQANSEYKNGQCEVSGKMVEGRLNSTKCSVEFVTSPSPKITGYGSYGPEDEDNLDGPKCVDKLYRGIKALYPDIKPMN